MRDIVERLWNLPSDMAERTARELAAGEIERLRAENEELRSILKEYESDPDYARSRFREIDLLKDQRAHDRLKIQGLRARVEETEEALREIRDLIADDSYSVEAVMVKTLGIVDAAREPTP